jgi:adenosylcobinamide amidohydrolase
LLLEKTPAGDLLKEENKALFLLFQGQRNVLSSSPWNGGYREDLRVAFNYDEKPADGYCRLRAATYQEHLRLIAAELGLDPARATGLSTAASMRNAAMAVETHGRLSVAAIVTAGVAVNGGRAGDPAAYEEQRLFPVKPGTINILLEIDAALPPAAMAGALITATEAKVAALQELLAGSNYSTGLATGSGTDGAILVSHPEAPLRLTDPGKHSKLGELIGRAVLGAVKEALARESDLTPESQHSVLQRFKRYGMDEEWLWRQYQKTARSKTGTGSGLSKAGFSQALKHLDRRGDWVAAASLYIHLMDQYAWGMLHETETSAAAAALLDGLGREWGSESGAGIPEPGPCDHTIQALRYAFAQTLLAGIAGTSAAKTRPGAG